MTCISGLVSSVVQMNAETARDPLLPERGLMARGRQPFLVALRFDEPSRDEAFVFPAPATRQASRVLTFLPAYLDALERRPLGVAAARFMTDVNVKQRLHQRRPDPDEPRVYEFREITPD